MRKYIIKRLISAVITVFVLITITFLLMHAVPGSPFQSGEENIPQVVLERLRDKYGLNEPLGVQYLTYLKNILKGDFGISFIKPSRTVNDIINQGFPVSARVGALAVVYALIMGTILGVISALRKGSIFDNLCRAYATAGVSIPTFVTSVLLLYLLAGHFKILPAYGISSWQHYILPVVCLSFSPIAYIARMTRSSMLEVMQMDYIRTARAKGVSRFMVVFKHALRNAILPIVTYLGTLIAALLTGSFVIERLFAIPGIGKYFVQSVGDRDYNVILGITVFFGIFVVVCNIIVDILYVVIDPRVKFE